MTERINQEAAVKVRQALDHSATSDVMFLGIFAAPHDGGKSAQILTQHGISRKDRWAYFRRKMKSNILIEDMLSSELKKIMK